MPDSDACTATADYKGRIVSSCPRICKAIQVSDGGTTPVGPAGTRTYGSIEGIVGKCEFVPCGDT